MPVHDTAPHQARALFAPQPANTTASPSRCAKPAPSAASSYRWLNMTRPADEQAHLVPPSATGLAATASVSQIEDRDPETAPTTPRALLRPDDLCDADFRRESFLGEGTYSIVTLATHVPSGHVFALKEMMCGRLRAMRVSEQLQWEINVHRRLRHPNIVRLYSYYYTPEDDHIRLVLEYCSRGSLQAYVRRAPQSRLTEAKASRFMRHMARAVAYLHSYKLVHRDLKLENVLLDHRGVAKLADFGWSRQLQCVLASTSHKRSRDEGEEETSESTTPSSGVGKERTAAAPLRAASPQTSPHHDGTCSTPQTRPRQREACDDGCPWEGGEEGGATVGRSTVCGTLDYLSPEMVTQRPHTRKTDIWSLGVMLAEMLTGHTPFYRPSYEATMEAIRTAEPDLTLGERADERLTHTHATGVAKDKTDNASASLTAPTLSQEALSLVRAMLQKDPAQRPTMAQILAHPWLQKRDG